MKRKSGPLAVHLLAYFLCRLRYSFNIRVPKIAGSIPAEAVEFFGLKNPQHAFLGGEVKPSPMSQICAACQRTLGLRGSRNHGQS